MVVAAERKNGLKEEWTAAQLALAQEVTVEDKQLYDRAKRLSEEGLRRLFGTDAAVARARSAVEHSAEALHPLLAAGA